MTYYERFGSLVLDDPDEPLFTVEQSWDWGGEKPGPDSKRYWQGFVVSLPHQCSSWRISDGGSKAVAIADLTEFLRLGQEALERLKAMPERTGEVALPNGGQG